MGIINKIFGGGNKSKKYNTENTLKVDMHSHLLPNVDDGVESLEESIRVIQELKALGFEKLITTPHVMADFFKNSKNTLLPELDRVQQELVKNNINIEINCAAEYYLDDGFLQKLKDKDNLLLINKEYILVETSYMNKPVNLHQTLFEIQAAGLKPILAHPERYIYFYESFESYEELHEKNILFQINLNSLTGYYSKGAKKIAEKLVEKNMVNFFGTDCHGDRHIPHLKRALQSEHFAKGLDLQLLNSSLI